MKSLVFAFLCFSLGAAPLHVKAQSPAGGPPADFAGVPSPAAPDPDRMAASEIKWMKKKLKLSPEQLAKVTEISRYYATRQKGLLDSLQQLGFPPSQRAVQQFQEGMGKLMAGKDMEMNEVLSPEQFKAYIKKRDDGMESMGGPPQGFSGGRPPF